MAKISNAKLQAAFARAKEHAGKLLAHPEQVLDTLKTARKQLKETRSVRLGELFDDLMLMLELLSAYVKREYRKIPKRSIVAILAGVVYFINPLDIIPDAIPGIGYVDDALVLGLVLKQVKQDLNDFKLWRERVEVVWQAEEADYEFLPDDVDVFEE